MLDGGEGDDELDGGDGADIVIGGEGDDDLDGDRGRDLLIGGFGADKISGDSANDILIAGFTQFDLPETKFYPALHAILAEWNSTRAYEDRVANLRGDESSPTFGDRLNMDFFIMEDVTVFNDGNQDKLRGNSGRDWFLADLDEDWIADLNPMELVNTV